MRVIDLFCGAGGFSAGFETAGYAVVAGVDNNRSAVGTFRLAHPDAVAVCREVAGWEPPAAEVVIGGPPCPPFSTANNLKKPDDPRGVLWRDFLGVVERVEPQFWVMENVPGFQRSEAFGLIADHCRGGNLRLWDEPGLRWLRRWRLSWWVLNARDFGVAQSRPRLFMVGAARSVPAPETTGGLSLRECIGETGALVPEPDWSGPVPSPGLHFLYTQPGEAEVLAGLGAGDVGEWWGYPVERLRWDGVARAVLANSYQRPREANFHPVENRRLTTYEETLVQSFPPSKSWVANSKSDVIRQIGNAVPPRLAFHIATAMGNG